MRAAVLVLLAVTLLPGLVGATGHDPRPLCEGEPIVYLRQCYDGVKISTCTDPDVLNGAGCFVLGV